MSTFADHLSPKTPIVLKSVAEALIRLETADNDQNYPAVIRNELLIQYDAINLMLDAETIARDQLLETISVETRIELWMAGATLIALFVVVVWYLRNKILAPLHDLKELLLRLTHDNYTPINALQVDPLLAPIYNNYNVMVRHLSELENRNKRNAELLRVEVRSATRAVLEQQSSLANAERLAAVGELAAGLAHELRNPLAGVILSCANLLKEISDPDQVERLKLISNELKRIADLLSNLLGRSRQIPAVSTQFYLAELVRDLVALVRYQVSPNIRLVVEIPDSIECLLPEPNLRQALLNLILNATQAIGDKPGIITLTAYRKNKNLSIKVSDTGPGFAQNLLAGGIHTFHSTRKEGTGLGLAIVQRFARDMEGRILLSNVLPHGGCATLEFRNVIH